MALVGPFFVDWTAYRSSFEAYGERVLGHRVAVRGDADMRLLPIPTLTFTDVRVGEVEDPLLAVSRFVVRVELPPLLKGEVKVLDMKLERPELRLSLDEAGRLDWFTAAPQSSVLSEIDPDKVTLDQVEIVDGTATIIDARTGKTHAAADIDLLVTARSLLGPYKVDGTALVGGERATVRLATGKQDESGAIRLKTQLTPVSIPADFLFDGSLSHADGVPAYEGTFSVTSITPEEEAERAWRADGAFRLDVDALAATDATLRYGPEDRPVSVEGGGEIKISGAPRFDIRARSKQLDIDRLAGAGPQAPLDITHALDLVAARLLDLPPLPLPGRLRLDVPATVIGGGILQDLSLDAETHGSGWRVSEFSASLPGRSEVLVRGDLQLQPSPAFRGSFAASLEQPNGFADWYRKGVTLAETAAPLALQARVDASGSGIALSDVEFHIAEHVGRGTFNYRQPEGARASLNADLDAERVDLDQIGLLARLFLAGPDGSFRGMAEAGADVSLKLFADEVIAGDVTAKSLAVDARYSGDSLSIEEFIARDIAGAQVSAKGTITDLSTKPQGALDGSVEATDLTGAMRLVRSVLPDNAIVARLSRSARLLSPARLSVRFSGEGEQDATRAGLYISGALGGSAVDGRFVLNGRLDEWRQADIDISANLSAPDGAKLLQQLGISLLPVASLGEGRVNFSMAGIADDVLQTRIRADADGASLLAVGQATFSDGGPPRYAGDLVLKAEDLMPFALLTGRLPPLLAGDASVDLAMALSGEGETFTLRNIEGSVAGTQVRGEINGDMRSAFQDLLPKVSGKIALSTLDLAFLTEAILGPDQWSSATAGAWPKATFGQPLLDGVDLALDLEADDMELGGGFFAHDAKAKLRLKPNELNLDGGEAGFAGGRLSGALAIKRSDGQAGITGSLRLADADLSSFVWKRDGRPIATGSADFNAEFEASGRSINGLVANLAGGGTIAVKDGEIRSLNPHAFGLVIRAADAGLELKDERITSAFESHLDLGSLPFRRIDASFTLAGGVARMRNVTVDNERADLFGNAQIDLEKMRLQSDFALKVDPGDNAVTGAEPQVGLVFEGDIGAPARRIDIAPFTAFLTLRAFEQEVRRVEELQADILERDKLTRELRRQKQERQRKVAEEARRLAEEEARRKAAEEAAAASAEQDTAAQPEQQQEAEQERPAPLVPSRAEPAKTEPAPEAVAPPQPGFEDRIRAVIEAADRRARELLTGPQPVEDSGLPLLDTPIVVPTPPVIDDPLRGDQGANDPTGSVPLLDGRSSAGPGWEATVPDPSRFLTLPDGRAVPLPN